jgi:hypothetical protein
MKDIEVPETLLKKRKQNEKAREERLAAATAARKVSHTWSTLSRECDIDVSFDRHQKLSARSSSSAQSRM